MTNYAQLDGSIEFEYFLLAHNSKDKEQAEKIAKRLRRRKLNPWLDKEQILPGELFQKRIQKAIPLAKSAAIIIGKHGLGEWQDEEIQFLLSKCKKGHKPIFLILLPGVDSDSVPDDLGFIEQRRWISCNEGMTHALDMLESGIRRQSVRPSFDTLLCYRDEDVDSRIS